MPLTDPKKKFTWRLHTSVTAENRFMAESDQQGGISAVQYKL
jgi:hypothetical protein